MTISLAVVQQWLDRVRIPYVRVNDSELGVRIHHLDHYRDRDGDPEIGIVVRLTEAGERLSIIVPYAFQLAENRSRGGILRQLMSRQYENRFIRYEFDPDDGEVRMIVDVILEDNQLESEAIGNLFIVLLQEAEEVYPLLESKLDRPTMAALRGAERDSEALAIARLDPNEVDRISKAITHNKLLPIFSFIYEYISSIGDEEVVDNHWPFYFHPGLILEVSGNQQQISLFFNMDGISVKKKGKEYIQLLNIDRILDITVRVDATYGHNGRSKATIQNNLGLSIQLIDPEGTSLQILGAIWTVFSPFVEVSRDQPILDWGVAEAMGIQSPQIFSRWLEVAEKQSVSAASTPQPAVFEAALEASQPSQTVSQLTAILSEFPAEQIKEAIAKLNLDSEPPLKTDDAESPTELNPAGLAEESSISRDRKAAVGEVVDQLEITDSALLIRINRSYRINMNAEELYETTRGNWAISMERATGARYAYTIYQGKILQVYEIHRWIETDEISGFGKPRLRFFGAIAEDRQHYLGCNVAHYFKRGEASPTKYLNC